MAQPTSFNRDITSNYSPVSASTESAQKALAVDAASKARTVATVGALGIEAVAGAMESSLSADLKNTTNKLLKSPAVAAQAAADLSRAEQELAAVRASTVFATEDAGSRVQQQQLTMAEKAFSDEVKRIRQAVESNVISVDEGFTRMAARLRQSIAAAPGFGDRFRKLAADITGDSRLEVYELRKLVEQDTQNRNKALAEQLKRTDEVRTFLEKNTALGPKEIEASLNNPTLFAAIYPLAQKNRETSFAAAKIEEQLKDVQARSALGFDGVSQALDQQLSLLTVAAATKHIAAANASGFDARTLRTADGNIDWGKFAAQKTTLEGFKSAYVAEINILYNRAIQQVLATPMPGVRREDKQKYVDDLQKRKDAAIKDVGNDEVLLNTMTAFQNNANQALEQFGKMISNARNLVDANGGQSSWAAFHADPKGFSARNPHLGKLFSDLQSQANDIARMNRLQGMFSDAANIGNPSAFSNNPSVDTVAWGKDVSAQARSRAEAVMVGSQPIRADDVNVPAQLAHGIIMGHSQSPTADVMAGVNLAKELDKASPGQGKQALEKASELFTRHLYTDNGNPLYVRRANDLREYVTEVAKRYPDTTLTFVIDPNGRIVPSIDSSKIDKKKTMEKAGGYGTVRGVEASRVISGMVPDVGMLESIQKKLDNDYNKASIRGQFGQTQPIQERAFYSGMVLQQLQGESESKEAKGQSKSMASVGQVKDPQGKVGAEEKPAAPSNGKVDPAMQQGTDDARNSDARIKLIANEKTLEELQKTVQELDDVLKNDTGANSTAKQILGSMLDDYRRALLLKTPQGGN